MGDSYRDELKKRKKNSPAHAGTARRSGDQKKADQRSKAISWQQSHKKVRYAPRATTLRLL